MYRVMEDLSNREDFSKPHNTISLQQQALHYYDILLTFE